MSLPNTRASESDYEKFRVFLESRCGIELGEHKNYLIDTRMRSVLQQHNLDSLGSLVAKLHGYANATLVQDVVDAMTTNETLWLRDKHPFDYFKNELLTELSEIPSAHAMPIRIWSAACSSGQEPYSIAMCHQERAQNSRRIEITATDICETILQRARKGVYEAFEINRGLDPQQIQQHFTSINEQQWQINPRLQQAITFKAFNLQNSFSPLGRFDIIFCRNVLIYFSAKLQDDILRRFRDSLTEGGCLIIGSTEQPNGIHDYFDAHYYGAGVVFRRKA